MQENFSGTATALGTADEPLSLGVIDRPSLKAIALERIREAILRGKLKPGQRITEIGLARSLGVGQATIREALIDLEHQGLIQRRGSRKTVMALTARDIEEIYAVRTQLETFAVSLLANVDCERLADAERACSEMVDAARSGEWGHFWQADLGFHQALWRATGNQHLAGALEQLVAGRFALVVIRRRRADRKRLEVIASGHRELLQLIEAGETQAARALMEKSMQRAWADDLDSIKEPA